MILCDFTPFANVIQEIGFSKENNASFSPDKKINKNDEENCR
jgi:hypothetical protein